MHRIGIIPFDLKDQLVAILFVTSQTRGRWILPKGLVKKRENQVEACEREAFEEAGIKGTIMTDFPITLPIQKQTEDGPQAVPVTYYPFLVTEQADEWPEMNKRERHWALVKDAGKVTYREDYQALVNQFEALLPWIREAAVKMTGKSNK